MVENEVAVIFMRYRSECDSIEEFVPVKMVEGYYDEEEDVFVDTEQNVYIHIACSSTVGNVYGLRKTVLEFIKMNERISFPKLKQRYLSELLKYSYYKSMDSNAIGYEPIRVVNKETGESLDYMDQDAEEYYKLYAEFNAEEEIEEPEKIVLKKRESHKKEEKIQELTPLSIIEKVKKTIKGQDKALESIVTLLWVKYNFPETIKNNMLIIGPTGVGKTAIFKKIKEIIDVPLSIYTVTGVSQTGYKGHDIEEMLVQLYLDSEMDIEKAQNGIIIIDEFDKIASNRDTGEIGTIAVQNELLKLIEGCEKIVSMNNGKAINIDTSNIVFVCCGAFTELYQKDKKKMIGFGEAKETEETSKITVDKIIDYGIIRELAGRLPIIIELNDINNDKNILKDILLNSEESNLKYILNALYSAGIEVENLDSVIDYIVEDAIKRKIGARGLINSTIKMFLKIFYEIGNNPNKYEKVTIGNNIIHDSNDFVLVPRKAKKRVKTKEATE